MAQPNYTIADLHCDLLIYLQTRPERTPYDLSCRCAYPQLHKGGVKLQTLAIFTSKGPGAVQSCQEQVQIFLQLPEKYPEHFKKFDPTVSLNEQNSSKQVQIIAAFENAIGFCERDEPIEKGLEKLTSMRKLLKHILYISMTWDGENRFGGGVGSDIGLKDDGKKLLEWMHDKNIAIDLSHASDFLADDIFNYIDKKSLNIPIIASHSNARYITPLPRNLTDELAKEIIRRNGLIGLNFFSAFSGNQDHRHVIRHVEHIYKLGGEKSLCFGADFFCDADYPSLKEKYNSAVGFFPELADSSTYPYLLGLLQNSLFLSEDQMRALSYQNVQNFLTHTLCCA